MFLISKILTAMILPPGCIIVVLFLFLILGHTRKQKQRDIFFYSSCLMLVLFYLLSIRPVSDILLSPLEKYATDFAIETSRHNTEQEAELIVILGGGSILTTDREGKLISRLSPIGTARLLEGILLSDELGIPLLFSGGNVLKGEGAATEADAAESILMRSRLSTNQYQLEDKSRNTYENALFTAEETKARDIILITSAFHMKRSISCFHKAGFRIIGIRPVDTRLDRKAWNLIDFFPGIESMQSSITALHEYGGLLYYRIFYKL